MANNIYSDRFEAAYQQTYGMPYIRKKADFVQLHRLFEGLGPKLTLEVWERGVANYFQSELGMHTLADLSCRFVPFWKAPLDRFGKPKPAEKQVERAAAGKKEERSLAGWHQRFLIRCYEFTKGHPERVELVEKVMDDIGAGLIGTEAEAMSRLAEAQ